MERKHISAVALVTGALLLSSCQETERYQMTVTPPFWTDGTAGSHIPTCYVLDTKTGVVYIWSKGKFGNVWDPVNKTIQLDTITLKK